MRIAIVTLALAGRGGMERVFLDLDACWARDGHSVHWFFLGPGVDEPTWDAPFQDRKIYYGLDADQARGFALVDWALGLRDALHAAGPFDVVVAATSTNMILYPLVRLATGSRAPWPIVAWQHMALESAQQPSWIRYTDAVLAVSHGIADFMNRQWPEIPVAVTGNPVRDIGRRLIPRPADPTFIYVGRISEEKRLDRLIRAFARLDTAIPPKLVIYGSGDARLSEQLKNLAAAHDVSSRVVWAGWHPDPWSTIGNATALILASDREGWGVALAEALGHGVPVVAADCASGPRDIVQNGRTGWLFPPADEDRLASILRDVATGRAELPDAATCVTSVSKWIPETVAQEIINRLEEFRAGYPMP